MQAGASTPRAKEPLPPTPTRSYEPEKGRGRVGEAAIFILPTPVPVRPETGQHRAIMGDDQVLYAAVARLSDQVVLTSVSVVRCCLVGWRVRGGRVTGGGGGSRRPSATSEGPTLAPPQRRLASSFEGRCRAERWLVPRSPARVSHVVGLTFCQMLPNTNSTRSARLTFAAPSRRCAAPRTLQRRSRSASATVWSAVPLLSSFWLTNTSVSGVG